MYKWLLFLLFTGTCTLAQAATDKEKTVSQVKPEAIEVSPVTEQGDKLILGEKEWVYVKELDRNLKARIDTGATTSSISADVIDIKREKGKRSQVTFKLKHEDWEGPEVTLPVQRWVEVRQSSTEELDKRPVVDLPIQIGEKKLTTEFTLTDRMHLSYPVLIGRSFIDERAIVDVSHKYIQKKHKVAPTEEEKLAKAKEDEAAKEKAEKAKADKEDKEADAKKDAEEKTAKADDEKSDDAKDADKDSEKKDDKSDSEKEKA